LVFVASQLLSNGNGREREQEKERKKSRTRTRNGALLSPHGLVRGDALVEERERLAGGGAAAGERAALDVLERDEPGRGGEVAEDVLEEALVAGEAVLLLRLPEQLPEHRVVQVRRAAHAHGHVARRDNRLPGRRSVCRSQTIERILLLHLPIAACRDGRRGARCERSAMVLGWRNGAGFWKGRCRGDHFIGSGRRCSLPFPSHSSLA
jgi:hypothetical protein